MGKKHREKRKAVKNALKLEGWTENEFGELVKKHSKAEARRLLARRVLGDRLRAAQYEILDVMCKRAREELYAQMDAEIFHMMDNVIYATNPDQDFRHWAV